MKEWKKKKYFKKTFIIYLSVILFVVMAFLFLSVDRTINSDRNAYVTDLKNRMHLVAQTIDDQFKVFDSISTLLIDSEWVKKISSSSEIILSSVDYFQQKEISEIINGYNRIADITDSVALLLPNRSLAIDKVSLWYEENRYFASIGITDDNLLQNIYTDFNDFSSNTRVYPLIDGRFLLAKRIKAYQNADQIFVFIVNDFKFWKFVQRNSSVSEFGFEIIHDQQPIALFRNEKEHLRNIRIEFESEYYDWSYYFNVEDGYHIEDDFKLLILLTVVFGIAISIFSAILLARLNYKPIESLQQKLGMNSNSVSLSGEFDEIVHQFEVLREEHMSIQKISNNYYEIARNNIIFLLLHGAFCRQTTDDLLDMFGIPFTNDPNNIYLVSATPLNQDIHAQSVALDTIRLRCYLQEKEVPSLVINTPDNVLITIIYLNKNKDNITCSELINKYTNILRRYISNNLDCKCYLGLPHHGINGLSKSYHESMEAMEERETGSENDYYFPLDWEMQLIQQVRYGNKEATDHIMYELKKENLARQLSETQNAHVLMLVWETLRRVAMSNMLNTFTFDFEEIQLLHSQEEKWNLLMQYAEKVCNENSSDGNPLDSEEIGYMIQKYIDDNYRDPNLSQKMIADHFHTSNSNISKIFKSTVGINFINYLQNLRITAAHAMFEEGNKDIHFVSEQCGYTNDVTFRRAFFQYYAITPHQYVQQLSDNMSNKR